MSIWVRELWTRIKESIWFYPFLYGLLSFVGAGLVVLIDSRYFESVQRFIPDIVFTSVDLAKLVLGIIAGSFITITTFTFSTTMVVLTMYSSQFSPRTVENFLADKSTMQVFGVFFGGFIYSIVSLLFMRNAISEYMVIAASIGVLYMIAGLVFFSIFIHNVAMLIQVSNLIEKLYKDCILKIDAYKNLLETGVIVNSVQVFPPRKTVQVISRKNGYLQQVDHAKIVSLAAESNAIIVFRKVVGQFVTDCTGLFSLYFKEEASPDESFIATLLESVVIGERKTEKQDFSFTIQKIVEVALRAVSPGINDPNTANHCIRILGVLLGSLAATPKGYLLMRPQEGGEDVAIFEAVCFETILHDAFSQILHYAKEDVSVVISIFKALRFAMEKASKENREVILAFSEYVWNKLPANDERDMDFRMLRHEKEELYSCPVALGGEEWK